MTEKQEHTALPWEYTVPPWEWRDDQMTTPDNPVVQWTISPGVLIADGTNGTPGGDAIDRANAALIVRAVNSHHAMLEALEGLLEMHGSDTEEAAARAKARAAIRLGRE